MDIIKEELTHGELKLVELSILMVKLRVDNVCFEYFLQALAGVTQGHPYGILGHL